MVTLVRVENRRHRSGRADGKRRLLDHDLVAIRPPGDAARRRLPVLEIGCAARPPPEHLRRRVDADEDDVARSDAALDIRREEEVPATHLPDDVLQARFVDRKIVAGRVPGVDTHRIDVDDMDAAPGVLQRNDSHRRATDVARANADDISVHLLSFPLTRRGTAPRRGRTPPSPCAACPSSPSGGRSPRRLRGWTSWRGRT